MFVKPPLPARGEGRECFVSRYPSPEGERVGRGVRRDLASPGPAPQGGSSPLYKRGAWGRLAFCTLTVRIEAATKATAEVRDALAVLLPQLNRSLPIPSLDHLAAVVADPAATLLVARDGPQIVGTAAVVVYRTPIWVKARIEALVKACIEVARARGAGVVELQSARSREAANRLYPRLGFELRESNVYRLNLR